MNRVTGTVRGQDATTPDGLLVRAVGRRPGADVVLGSAPVDDQGRYTIDYEPGSILALHTEARAAEATVLVRSPQLLSPGPAETVDLVLPPPDHGSEFAAALAAVEPHLAGTPLAELATDPADPDVVLVATLAGRTAAEVARLALAHRYAAATDLPPTVFYGLLGAGVPADLSAMAVHPTPNLHAALASAGATGQIPAMTDDEITATVDRLRARQAAELADPPDDGMPEPLAALLRLAVPEPAARARAAAELVADAPADPTDRLALTLRLGELTDHDVPLVARLLDRFDDGSLTDAADLAGWRESDWAALLTGPDHAERARRLHDRAGALDPTRQVARRLADDAESSDAPAARYLREHPEFDLRATVLDPAQFPGDEGRELLDELRAMQRVFRIAPDVDALRELRADGIGSALEVARTDRPSFVARFAPRLGAAAAAAIHERAAQAHATATQLVAEHHAFNQLRVAALPRAAERHPDIPDWSVLFDSPDHCACDECRSVLGVAAYLADLLHFLADRQKDVTASGTTQPVLFTLLARRPDLAWTELSCANSTLELPYVDLVNQLLERAVDPSTIDWLNIDADHPPTPAQRASLQTTGTAAELRAGPQHVTPGAYTTLRDAPFPWTLPFDLWGVETRTWLAHLGVRRDELMVAFGAPPLDVAAEYLELAPLQHRILGEAPAAPFSTPQCYGFPAGTADLPAELPTVRRLLDVTGLAYAELVELLRMRFVDPTGALRIEPTDATDPDTCDTTRLRVAHLDTPALHRLHRFVRLRRALNWPAARLDRTLAALGGTLDASTILVLATVRRLAARTGLPVERLLPLWAPVDTADRYPDDRCLYDQVFLDPGTATGAAAPLRLRADRAELATPADRADLAVGAALQGALGVSHDELALLLTGPTAVVAGDELRLADLTALLRTVTLARALGRPVADLLALIRLAGPDEAPFPQPDELTTPEVVERTLRFVAHSDAIADSGLDVARIDASLTGSTGPAGSAGALPDEATLGRTLADLRAALRTVLDQTALTTDDDAGTTLRRQLALLGWSPGLVEDALGTLRGNVVYPTGLAALPDDLAVPPELRTVLRHDGATLTFAGAMTAAQYATLTQLSDDAEYRAAVDRLHDAPRHFIRTRMGAFTPPLLEAALDALPTGMTMPADLAATVFHDGNTRRLRARGFLGPAELERLRALSADDGFRHAVDALAQAQEAVEPGGDPFLAAADADALFDEPGPATERFAHVLRIAQPRLWRGLAAAVVEQRLSEAVGLPLPTVGALVGTWLRLVPGGPVLLDDLLDPAFVAADATVVPTRAVAGRQLAALALLHRVALLVGALRIDAGSLPWVIGRAATAGWLDLSALPAPDAAQEPSFSSLLRLLDLVAVRDRIPGGARTLADLFALADDEQATGEKLEALLVERTGWNAADLAHLSGPEGLQLTLPTDLGDERALDRLLRCVGLLSRLGVSAVLASGWAAETVDAPQAEAARQAARSHYREQEWAAVAGPVRDELRDRQRAALVAYLVAHPLTTERGPAWADAHELYQYHLVDVEMGPCRTTSRIVLATHSIQLYVQRCLLNLEPDVTIQRPEGAEYDPWSEWEWMSRFRVWQANRRTFLYPENYVRPELRREKSPFFVELENTLKQRDVTDEAVEAVFRTYLERVDTVARLQPCGMYREVKRNDEGTVVFDLLHVFARTWVTPHVYYYRQLRDGITWTPWETVDLDIQGDHLIPVTWKGRLFVFWPLFVRTADEQPITMPGPDEVLADPPRRWATQFAWSERKNGRWLPKQLITENISTRVRGAADTIGNFLFRADSEFDPASNLTLSCYKKPDGGAGSAERGSVVLSTSKAVRTSDPAAEVTLGAPPLNTAYVGLEYVEQVTNNTLGNALMVATDPLATQKQHLLLARTPGVVPYRLLYPNHYDDYPSRPFIANDPTAAFFFVDGTRSYFVVPDPTAPGPPPDPTPGPPPAVPIRFTNFYHPFVEMLIGKLGTGGVAALLDRAVQTQPSAAAGAPQPFDFVTTYGPELPRNVHPAEEAIDFGYLDGYGLYNWELFFHVPLMLAQRLTTNQRFAEAQRWFHTIFNPTDRSGGEAPQRFWQTKPFFETTHEEYRAQRIEAVLRQLAGQNPPTELVALVRQWRQNPFQPDLIARIRTTAYQKAVVMSYLDLLLAWGDQLFRQNTGESTTQATQLYVLAAEILGRRPEEVIPPRTPAPLTYTELAGMRIDPFANALVAAEHLVPTQPVVGDPPPPPPGLPAMLYFGIPRNDKLLGYWDVVADRLGKIRQCLTIDGAVSRQPLTEPPLDLMAIVAAVAGGQDVATALADVDAPLPRYRFATLTAKAGELAGELRTLSAGLLAALEKRDGERMARLRSDQEIRVLTAAREVRRHQVDEATAALIALQRSRETAVARQQYYASRPFLNDGENAHVTLASEALDLQESASAIDMTANILGLIPDFKLGSPTTIGATFGGTFLTQALRAFSSSLNAQAGLATGRGGLSATLAGFRRRADDWQFQADQAAHEITGLDQQIAAASVRLDVARTELANHDLQAANARETDAFLHGKYTAQELYDWTVEQVSTLYFSAYQLAYDTAKRAEQAYRFELGVATSNFVHFGYWDSLHKGLLAGERLVADLKRMEASYLELHQREYELTKRISLAATDPLALVALRRTGECFVSLPEALFDLDAPGHYHRRIRSVAFSLPCVTGPFTTVNCTATLLRSAVRTSSALVDKRYARRPDDPRFRDYTGSVQTVVTSTGVEDTGLFEPNLRDERYLPFEGAGVVGDWHLRLPATFRQFDYETLTDVVMHVRYTAREGGRPLADAVEAELRGAVNAVVAADGGTGLTQVISARTELPDAWSRFLRPLGGAAAPAVLTVPLSDVWIPFPLRHRTVTVTGVQLLLPLADADTAAAYAAGVPLTVTLAGPHGAPSHTGALRTAPGFLAGTPVLATNVTTGLGPERTAWTVTATRADIGMIAEKLRTGDDLLRPEAVRDLLVVLRYTIA